MTVTGERCTSSGAWRSVCCTMFISRDRGEWFPVCPACERQAWWELIHPILSHPQRTIQGMETLNISVIAKKSSNETAAYELLEEMARIVGQTGWRRLTYKATR
jgi:hypothetical protein